MHALPKSEQSRVDDAAAHARRSWRRPPWRASSRPASSRRAAAGRALLACWTSIHGLASLAVSGQMPVANGMALAVSLDAVLRTALMGAGVDPALLPPELPLPDGACPGIAELVREAAVE